MSVTPLGNYLLTEEVKVERIPGRGLGLYSSLLGNVKSTVYGRIQALQCYKLLSGDKGEGSWIVGLLRNEILGSRAVRRNLGSRVTLK